jgi:transcriptional regulator with PAS, ATPase and Fis domain
MVIRDSLVSLDGISQTIPTRPAGRDVGRTATLAVVGSAAEIDGLAHPRLMPIFGAGAEIGRRPPPGRMRTVVTLNDRSVSSYHAQITLEGDAFVIEDKGSTNGTMVDGHAIVERTALREGSVLFLGSQVLVFRTMTNAEMAAVEADIADSFAPVATLAPALAIICAKLKRLAPSPTELFLLGETGVGKEVFANAIHALSGRRGRMLAVNCAALPRELVESELFGYERGAHSTAKDRKPGLIEAADGGTLFLDELAEMPLDVQSKLLRFLQDRKYMAIGSTRLETANVRIIAASSRVAGARGAPMIQDALLGRLGAQPILLPALRERREDLGRLVAYFLGAVGCNRPLAPEAFQALFLYGWPHNIRELQKVITEAELLSRDEDAIGLDHLPPTIVGALDRTIGSGPISRATGAPPRVRRPVPSAEELRALMVQFNGNVAHIATHLGRQWAVISRTLRRYGIDPAEYRPVGAPESLVQNDSDDSAGTASDHESGPIPPGDAHRGVGLIVPDGGPDGGPYGDDGPDDDGDTLA